MRTALDTTFGATTVFNMDTNLAQYDHVRLTTAVFMGMRTKMAMVCG
jgi:hypothetical protein